MKSYRLSPAGQRLTLILLVTALLIWAFALWSFASTLRISYNPLQFWPSLQASLEVGLGVGQVVPALLMLCLIVATPLLLWSLLEEWAACYTPTDDGLRFRSLLGINLLYPWSSISAVRRADDDADEPLDELILNTDQSGQIAQPWLRFLHRQAFGGKRLPIYAGIEDRDELLDTVRQRLR
ncbi:MAG: hypothetical protein EI684_12615 [Candidatus Viridilinea halotolerans]|uniref:Uncharacterized protein n=1 Tax=Candidatus Viridilinea halotolerans TaxID=2491704 RepID=A0A426TY41_9CHLR|nr:MAG: hypothetical protein EI684_12615 [Candidatus Viridilinea halotolerans]